MPKIRHSPSSFSCAAKCERRWWYEYVLRIREEEPTWEEILAGAKHTPGQRSKALGTATHTVLEKYYAGQAATVDWSSEPGQIALTGIPHLPILDALLEPPRIEQQISIPGLPIELTGYVDLRVRLDPQGQEAIRLGLAASLALSGGWLTIDYKTSSDVDRYALSGATLLENEQGVIYAADAFSLPGCEEIHNTALRWVYMQTKKRKFAKPVDTLAPYTGTKRRLDLIVDRGLALEAIGSEQDARQNPASCGDYGGCPHHIDRGGRCSPGRIAKEDIFPMGAFADKQAALKAQTSATSAGANTQPEVQRPVSPPGYTAPPRAEVQAEPAPTEKPAKPPKEKAAAAVIAAEVFKGPFEIKAAPGAVEITIVHKLSPELEQLLSDIATAFLQK